MGSYSCVHCERTRRNVMEDFPQPPSPQIVIVIFWASSMVCEMRSLDIGVMGCRWFEKDRLFRHRASVEARGSEGV